MRIAGVYTDSIVDGPGLRFTVFVQGCHHNCTGCHNPESHDPDGGDESTIEELEKMMLSNPLTDGLTLSGGEPFLQAEECAKLAWIARENGLNVWTYTGYTYEDLLKAGREEWNKLLDATDVLVDGPFILEEKTYDTLFRGSRNQRLIAVKESRQCWHVVLFERK